MATKRKYLTEEEIIELIKEHGGCKCEGCDCKKEEAKVLPMPQPKLVPEMKKPMPPKAQPWWIRMWSR